MTAINYIDRGPLGSNSLNYAYLREEAMKVVREYCQETWTDHNAHDPGITLLEALCYAITDVGNRSNLPIADLLMSQEGVSADDIAKNFPDIERILPNAALSLLDNRRLLGEGVFGVRRLRLLPALAPEIPVFLTPDNEVIKVVQDTDFVNGSRSLKLNGLYEIQVEWGAYEGEDLNSNLITTQLEVTGQGDHRLLVVLQYWDEMAPQWLDENVGIQSITLEDQIVFIADSPNPNHNFYAEFTIDFTDGSVLTDFVVNAQVLPAEIEAVTSQVIIDMEALLIDPMASPLQAYKQRLEQIGLRVAHIQDFYLTQRNLCEDLVRVKGLRVQEILLTLDLDLKPGTDPVAVLSRGLLAIEEYLSPRFAYKSLEELLGAKNPDEIYEGPLLANGFLPPENLLETDTKETIYVSDLIALLMEDSAVMSVSQLALTSAINGSVIVAGESNCLRISATDRFIPRLSLRNFLQGYTLTRNGHPIATTPDLWQAIEDEMAAVRASQQVIREREQLSRPTGERVDMSDFSSLQNDLPINYAIGRAMPGQGAGAHQQSSSRQLQAYLYVFDQILAQHAQLVGGLFQQLSIANEAPVAYPTMPLFTVPGLPDLLRSFTGDDWEVFINDPDNLWTQQLQEAAGIGAEAAVQKQQILDHLLARQGENLAGFDDLLTDLQVPRAAEIANSARRKLLTALPELAAQRGLAFNYGLRDSQGNPFVWDTDNVSGAERMICHKLGWPSCRRRSLFNNPASYFQFYEETDDDGITERRFRLRDIDTGQILLSSSISYPTDADARVEIEEIMTYGAFLDHYRVIRASNGSYYFRLFNAEEEIIAWRIQGFESPEEALEEVARVSAFIYETFSMEGLYFLENILLRPIYEGDQTLERIRLREGGIVDNSYAFVVTVVIPTGNMRDFSASTAEVEPLSRSLRWREPAFTQYLIDTISREVPAATLVNLVRLDLNSGDDLADTPSLQNFERTYRQWLETRFRISATVAEKEDAHNELVEVLNTVNSLNTDGV